MRCPYYIVDVEDGGSNTRCTEESGHPQVQTGTEADDLADVWYDHKHHDRIYWNHISGSKFTPEPIVKGVSCCDEVAP